MCSLRFWHNVSESVQCSTGGDLAVLMFGCMMSSVPDLFQFSPTWSFGPVWSHFFLGKGKVHPRTGHEGTEGEMTYSSTFSLTSALDGVRCQHHAPAALPPGNTHCVGPWVGPRAPENLASAVIRSPDSPAHNKSLYRMYFNPLVLP